MPVFGDLVENKVDVFDFGERRLMSFHSLLDWCLKATRYNYNSKAIFFSLTSHEPYANFVAPAPGFPQHPSPPTQAY